MRLQMGFVPVDAGDGRIEIAGAMRRAPQVGQIDGDGVFTGIIGGNEIGLVPGIDRVFGGGHTGKPPGDGGDARDQRGFRRAIGHEAAQKIVIELAKGQGIFARIGGVLGIKPVAVRVAPHPRLAGQRARPGGGLRIRAIGRGLGIGNDHNKGPSR